MNMPYEIFLTIQLMHLTCRKYRVQSPTRKEGWDLFQRTSDDSSRFTLIIQNEEWWLECDIETWREFCSVFHMDLQDPTCNRWKHRGIQGKIRSTRLLMKRRHKLWRDICSHWKLRHTRVCKLKKTFYKIRRHPWDNTYMRSLNIT